MEIRVKNVMRDLKIPGDKALSYLNQLDEDIEKWVSTIHKIDSREPSQYDIFVNLQNMNLDNAATLISSLAKLDHFRPTPASLQLMDDLYLAAQAKLRLAFDERTAEADVEARADQGVLTVTYSPRQAEMANDISKVLEGLEGYREIQCTMAETTILWLQEEFDPKSASFDQLIQLAQRWGAAVELLQCLPPVEGEAESFSGQSTEDEQIGADQSPAAYTGGVEDDSPLPPEKDAGLIRTAEELVTLGRFGGQRKTHASHGKIQEAVMGDGNYSLVVVGDMFLSKDHATRIRQTRELTLSISESIKAPVILADELKGRFLFSKKQSVKLLAFTALTVFIYWFVFYHQEPLLDWLGGDTHQKWKWATAVTVGLFVPFVAYIYSTVTGLLLKLINLD